ncbi:MAG: 1,4-dihydroxy-2-naphthoate octaprenyltransferase [Candidatus Omnitrophica bacterium]|nr:1,4-dihydroxy-2-naphthoate octaprenyltransferase [Candidatus Omnitrophota bacterium]
MNKTLIWAASPRPQFFTAAIIPVVLGAAVAVHQTGAFDWGLLWLTMAGALFVHAGLNLTNDYYDYISGDDVVNKTPTPFSGGSRLLPDGALKPREVLTAGLFCLAVTVAIGVYLVYALRGYLLLPIGIAGLFLVFFYTAPPFRIGYTGFAELATGIGFGPLMVLGSYYVQARRLSWEAFWASVPVGILIALVLYINEFPDYEADRISGKRNTVVSIGKAAAAKYYRLFLLSVYLVVLLGIASGIFPFAAILTFVTLPAAIKAIRVTSAHFDKIKELLPANALTIAIHLSFGILFTFAYLWGTK